MNQSELTRIFCERPQNFAWLLGAGASCTAGLPTATDIIWDLKKRYYCSEENQDISRQDIQHDALKARIQSFMEAKGFPAEWTKNEYSTYFNKIFGEDKERQRKYLNAILSEDKVTLSVGNRVMGALLATGLSRVAFTTNFDSVIEKAVAHVSDQSLSAYHLEGARSADQALNNEEYPLYCKLHGDFRHNSVKNLSSDLAKQNDDLSNCFVNCGNRFGFIVSGYSGRDESVMELLRSVLRTHNPFPHGFFWTGIKGTQCPDVVESFLVEARGKDVNAQYIEIETFDSLMLRLWRNIENKPTNIDNKVKKSEISSVNIPLPPIGNGKPIIRLNTLPVTSWPLQCWKLSFNKTIEWDDLKAAQRDTDNQLIFARSEFILCWGSKKIIKEHFGQILSSIEDFELSEKIVDLSSNLHLKRFYEDALCAALVRDKPLLTRSTRNSTFLIVDRYSEDQGSLEDLFHVVGKSHGDISGLFTQPDELHRRSEQISWAEAVRISVDFKDNKFWLVIDPDIWIWPNRARRLAIEFMDDRRRNRFNKMYNDILSAWVKIILDYDKQNTEIEVHTFDDGKESENPSFKVGSRTAYAKKRVE